MPGIEPGTFGLVDECSTNELTLILTHEEIDYWVSTQSVLKGFELTFTNLGQKGITFCHFINRVSRKVLNCITPEIEYILKLRCDTIL